MLITINTVGGITTITICALLSLNLNNWNKKGFHIEFLVAWYQTQKLLFSKGVMLKDVTYIYINKNKHKVKNSE